MTLILDKPRIIGSAKIAAVSEKTISRAHSNRRVAASCSKIPTAILFRRGERVFAFDLEGAPIEITDLEKRCPEALATFKNLG